MSGRIIERLVSSGNHLNLIRAYVMEGDGGYRYLHPPKNRDNEQRTITQAYMSDEEVRTALYEYEDFGFDDLPDWLRDELQARSLPHEKRKPTTKEIEETNFDQYQERFINNKPNLKELINIMKGQDDGYQR